MIASKKDELDAALGQVLTKIEAGTVTCEDFNGLIQKTVIGESTPEAVRNRVRRRTTVNPAASHVDNETGHQPLNLPTFADRVQPKRQPGHQQSHGRAALAHKHSARTQAGMQTAIEFIQHNVGKPLSEEMLEGVDRESLQALATRLISQPNVDRDWLYGLVRKFETDLMKELENG